MKHAHKVLTLAGATLVLGACSSITGQDGYLRDKGSDYLQDQMTPELKIPASLDAVPSEEHMLVPQIDNKISNGENVVPRADQRIVQDDGVTFQIVQIPDGRMLLTDHSPAVIWSYILKFWDNNNIPVTEQNAAAGVMETDWVQLGEKSNPGMMRQLFGKVIDLENSEVSQEKFRVVIRQGDRTGTSEVLLKHARLPIGADNQALVDWDDIKPGISTIYGELLNEMLMFMVQNSKEQGVTLRSEGLDANTETSIIRDGNGNPVLSINQSFARSWQAVDLALKEMGTKVSDKNRTAGLVYITLPGGEVKTAKEENSGWFSGWFSSSDSKATEKPAADDEYRIRVQSVGDNTHVTIEKDINTLPPVGLSEKFLERLKENLS